MKVLKLTCCLLCISMMVACSSKTSKKTDPQPDSTATVEVAPQVFPVTVQTLNGYFLKNTYKLAEDTSCVLFADQASFDTAFGVAKTMNNKVDKPEFDKDVVAAVAMKATKTKTEIAISKAEKVGEMINVYVEVTTGDALTYTMQPLVVFSFPKEAGINSVNFMMGGEVVKSFPLNVPATN